MRIIVEFADDQRNRATVTLIPGWFRRLLGGRVRRGIAVKVTDQYNTRWTWGVTGRDVDADFAGYPIRRALETVCVEPLPAAEARRLG